VLASITGTSAAAVEQMRIEELCARTIGSLYATAERVVDDNAMLINYNDLSVPVISRVLGFFKVSPSSEELEKIQRGSRMYSKEASGTRIFVTDTDAKQQLASNLVREVAETWAMKPYRRLERRRLEQK
jgi:hypothetical protein